MNGCNRPTMLARGPARYGHGGAQATMSTVYFENFGIFWWSIEHYSYFQKSLIFN